MPLANAGTLVQQAHDGRRAVLAFNLVSLEQAEGIVAGAERAGTAVIAQISENAVRFHGGRLRPLAVAAAEVARTAGVDVGLHLDHVTDEALWREAPAAGFTSVMVDASTLEHAANVEVTAAATRWLHEQGLWVEAELGEVGGKDGAHAPGVRTDPDEAAAYVAATGVDSLAVAVGSSHAMTERTAGLDLELIRRMRSTVPVPLVLHGSSGVSEERLAAAVAAGMVKINVGTLLGVAFTGAVRQRLEQSPALVDPRRFLGPGRQAVADAVAQVCAVLR
jgi:fructose-bisphosphate aldolase, class II